MFFTPHTVWGSVPGLCACPTRPCLCACFFGEAAAGCVTASPGASMQVEPMALSMFVPAPSSLLAYRFRRRRFIRSRLNHRGRLEPYEGSSAVISSQVDFLPSPSEFTAATR